jgi:class 3 adenylate cyclase/tetratricopeptide (TPR) repeat protein
MMVCQSCATELPDGSRFCLSCGARLTASSTVEERKVVTTLFCDLVGFTQMSEAADPEDVDALLRSFGMLARRVIESYGGVVEKFIGDAVVGVFGVPAAREDDPERAVRAGLRLLEGMGELPEPGGAPNRARVGVNTGRVLVRKDVDPASGQGFLVGDAVNTAARLQTAAPPMGVVVGDATHALTAGRFEYESLGALELKGRAAPMPAWLALRSITRTGLQFDSAPAAEFVGRDAELDTLTGLLEGVRDHREPSFALLVGEAGMGKSRLVFELARFVDQWSELVTWRQGTCPPYGDVAPFSALGQIVKAHAGILESDEMPAVEAKLEEMLSEVPDREWLGSRLRPLLGLDGPPGSPEENAAAWRRFLEGMAAERPAVLVFEDLHWADPSLLAFLRDLVKETTRVPLLVVGTARPELFEQHPDLLAAHGRVVRIDVRSLADDAARELAERLLHAAGVPGEVHGQVILRGGGNPLYIEGLVRYLADRRERAPGAEALSAAARDMLPDSLQALIAARLDVLPPDRKALLGDAAVVGQEFWSGALARVAARPSEEVEASLDDLAERDLVRPVRASAVEGERQFAFGHALTRDVAYQQLPRAARARKHAAVADWIERDLGGRVQDLADVLAHHRVTSLELARATGDARLADQQLEPAIRALALAGDRSLPLDVVAAEARYARAAALAESGPERPRVLARWGEALMESGRFRESIAVLGEAVSGLESQGDWLATAGAVNGLTTAMGLTGDMDGAARLLRQTIARVERRGPSPELVLLLQSRAAQCGVAAAAAEARPAADRALGLAAELGMDIPVEALLSRALWRCAAGDAEGLDDYRRAAQEARAQGLGRTVAVAYFNWGVAVRQFRGPRAALEVHSEGLEFARLRHDQAMQFSLRYGIAHDRFCAGDWADALEEASILDAEVAAAANWAELGYIRALEVRLLTCTGRVAEAVSPARWAEEAGRGSGEPLLRSDALVAAAGLRLAEGDAGRARDLLACLDLSGLRDEYDFDWLVTEAVRHAATLEDADLLAGLAGMAVQGRPLSRCVGPAVGAVVAESAGDHEAAAEAYAAAATAWEQLGVPNEQALALLGRGRCLFAMGAPPAEAAPPLTAAARVFACLGAQPAREAAEKLIRGRQ